jgi:membrane protease YdiL (CAAX protease family)
VKKVWLINEIAFLYFVILIYIWIIFPLGSYLLNLAGLLFILGAVTFSSIYHQKTFKDIGIRWDNFYDSFKLVGSFTSVWVVALFVLGILFKSICFTIRFIPDLLFYLLWGFLQQYAFQSFFNLRFSELFSKRITGSVATAIVFSSVHYPNPFLMPTTFILGFFWFWFFIKQPNLFVVSFSHALLGSLARYTLPLTITANLKVGTLYLLYR